MDFILGLVQTEKSVAMCEGMDKYTLKVRNNSNKRMMKEFFESVLKVKVLKVNSLNRKGARVSFKRRIGYRSDEKYMIVSVVRGSNVNFNLKSVV